MTYGNSRPPEISLDGVHGLISSARRCLATSARFTEGQSKSYCGLPVVVCEQWLSQDLLDYTNNTRPGVSGVSETCCRAAASATV